MSTTLRSLIISILLVIITAIIFRLSNEKIDVDSSVLKNYPAFVSEDFKTKIYDKDGFLYMTFNAEKASYYKRDDLFYVDNASLNYFEKVDNKLRSYQLNSNSFIAKPDSYVDLKGDIRIFPNFNDSFLENITAKSLFYDLKKQEITSKEQVNIKGKNFENSGYNLDINLKNKTIVISGEPHATFYPTTN